MALIVYRLGMVIQNKYNKKWVRLYFLLRSVNMCRIYLRILTWTGQVSECWVRWITLLRTTGTDVSKTGMISRSKLSTTLL